MIKGYIILPWFIDYHRWMEKQSNWSTVCTIHKQAAGLSVYFIFESVFDVPWAVYHTGLNTNCLLKIKGKSHEFVIQI